MSQPRRARSVRRAEEKTQDTDPVTKNRKVLWTRIIISMVVILIVAGISFAAYYPTNVAPFRRTIITVDDQSIRMDYFLKAHSLSGTNSIETLTNLAKWMIIKLEADNLGIEVTDEDVDKELRRIAQGDSSGISEAEFDEWYRQRINESVYTDKEYRELIETRLLALGLQEYLEARMSTIAEQVHLYSLFVETEGEAEKARERWLAGEDFPDLVAELAEDEMTREARGEVGWFPLGVLPPQFEFEAFNLATGNVSEPFPLINEPPAGSQEQPSIVGWALFWVPERAAAREVDENALEVLKAGLLDNWLTQQIGAHEVQYFGLKNGFDSETDAWIAYQLSKQ